MWNQALTNEELGTKFKATLKEYLQTLDVNYVGEYLRELSCHYYLHEFVRRAIVLAIETVRIRRFNIYRGMNLHMSL